jgi:hypothetical protein
VVLLPLLEHLQHLQLILLSQAHLATAAQPNITSVGTLTGLTTTGDINFGDDDKAVFGAGSDLQIYHDGTDSFVADAGTGRLILRGSSQVRLETATGTQMISADDGGAAKLYHNGVKKFDTTATGIDVTGLIPVGNGNVGIGTTSPAYILDVTGASAGVAKFKRSSVGTTEVLIDTAGSGDAQLVFADNGTDSYAIGRDNTNGDFVIAASGALGTSNLINIESGGNVGIGTTSPAGILHLHKDAGTAYLKQTNTINGQTLEIGNAYSLYTGANGAHSAIASDSVLAFATADTERMRIDSSGNLLVGKTATALGTAGLEIFNTGVQWLTASNTRPLLLNRTGSDGDIQEFRKDGASVGSIGVVSGDRIYIATADGLGLQFDKDNNRIVPCDAAGASNSNVELGDSGLEFTNLWLSGNATIGGGVVFGDAGGSGTSSSNTLDSYEEGTWTPTLSGYTTNPTPTAVHNR